MNITPGVILLIIIESFLGGSLRYVQLSTNWLSPFLLDFTNQSFIYNYNTSLEPGTLDMVFGLLSSLDNISCLFGTCFFALALDKLGRLYTLVLVRDSCLFVSCSLHFVGGLLNSWELVLLARILCGFSQSAQFATPIFIGETAADAYRGALVMLTTCGPLAWSSLGMLVSMPFAFGNQEKWMYFYLLPIPCVCFHAFLAFTLLHESPKFLYINQHKESLAGNSLKFYQGKDVDTEPVFSHYKLEEIQSSSSVGLTTVLRTGFLRRSLCLCLSLSLFSTYSGEYICNKYLNSVLQELGFTQLSSMVTLFLLSLLTLFATGITSLTIIERFNRRNLFFASFWFSILNTFFLALSYYVLFNDNLAKGSAIISLLFQTARTVLGDGTLGSVGYSELSPQWARAAVTQMALQAKGVSLFVVTLLFPLILDALGGWVLLSFTIATFAVLGWVWRNMPETRNRAVDEIVADLVLGEQQGEEVIMEPIQQRSYGTEKQ